jgi:2-polyprenyl-6-methoxyphenol hydroxylase-like FAD-dependent oxidoreductase
MMAAQLLRYGIQPVIIDNKQGPTTQSKALAVQARSLEIYRQMGVVDKVLRDGRPSNGLLFNMDGKLKAELSLRNLSNGQTLYPYVFVYEQSKNEQLLLEFLTYNCCPVYWNTTLMSLQQSTDCVTAQLSDENGEYALKCDWVIGADGAHSTIRKQMQSPFKGDTYPQYFFLADAVINSDFLVEDHIQIFLGQTGLSGFFPMTEQNNYRVIGNVPSMFEQNEELQVEDILPSLEERTHAPVDISHINWFTGYKLHHRMAEKFREGRCFLIGDAAHIHSPAGGQGMNTGLQDAYNLAWKLAGVINGQIQPGVLDSYSEERMPVARKLLRTTDRAFKMALSTKPPVLFFKRHILFRVLKAAWKYKKISGGFFKQVSQIGISYRESNINLHLSKSTLVKAGDRIPYLKVYDEKKETETDLHEWCSKPGFTLIIFGRLDDMYLFTLAKWITNKYNGLLNFFYLPPSGKNVDVFDAFEVDPHKQLAIIVRPDMHIGYMNDVADIGMMDNYLQNVAGIIPQK